MTSKAVREFPHRALITSFPERGLIGSRHHLGALSEDVRRHIALYINLDMVGSPNFARDSFRVRLRPERDWLAWCDASCKLIFAHIRPRLCGRQFAELIRVAVGSNDR